MERRTVCYHNYDEVLADAEALLASGYDRAGNWSLGQVCHHLALFMEMSLDGFPWLLPWPFRVLARWLVMDRILRHQVFRRRFRAPKVFQPPDALDDRVGMERLRSALTRLKQHTGPLQPSPVFGPLSPEQWREVHLWHSEHHLSFLLPKVARAEPFPCA